MYMYMYPVLYSTLKYRACTVQYTCTCRGSICGLGKILAPPKTDVEKGGSRKMPEYRPLHFVTFQL